MVKGEDMFNSFRKIFLTFLSLGIAAFSGSLGCGTDRPDLLRFPSIVTIDNNNARVFVIDNKNNRINLVDPFTDRALSQGDNGDIPLLDDDDDIFIQEFPSNAAVADLGGGVSRLFVIGANQSPSQQVIVFDYYTDALEFQVAPISPLTVPGSLSDVLVGIAVDQSRGWLLVTNSSSGNLYVYDIETGLEVAGSPVNLGDGPSRLSVDSEMAIVAVAHATNNTVSFVDLSDLTQPPVILDIGFPARDVSLVGTATGTLLWVNGAQSNVAALFELDPLDFSNATQLLNLVPTPPDQARPDPELLTGNLNFIFGGELTDGQVGGFYTQSSGDLLAVDVSSDFGLVTPNIISVGAASGEGIDGFLNSAGQVLKVYYASPGTGVLTVIDPLDNEFLDQIP